MRISYLLAAALLIGCDGTGSDDDVTDISQDTRIDGAGAGDLTIDSEGARMCQSANGNLYVVWYDDREGSNDIWFQASLNKGESWGSQAIQVNNGDGDATNPDIACIGNTVFVVWEDTRDGELENKNIYFSKSDSSGTSWLDEDVLLSPEDDAAHHSIWPRIASANDELVVVWSDGINGAYDIYAASSTNRGDDFNESVRVDSDAPGAAFSSFPQVALDGDGHVVVAWEDSRDENNDIYVAASSDAGVTYGADVRVDVGDAAGAANSLAPKVALSGGHAYVVWHDYRNGTNADILMNHSADNGATWLAEAAQVETDGAGAADSSLPRLAMTGTTAHIVWQDDRNGAFDTYYRSFVDGAARPVNQFPEGELNDAEFRLDVGDRPGLANSINVRIAAQQEAVVVAWEDRRFDGINYADSNDTTGTPNGFNDIYYNASEDSGMTWIEDRDGLHIDSYCRGGKWARDISVATDGDIVQAIWHDGRRGNADIMFGSVEIGENNPFTPNSVCDESATAPEE
ncbi:MAG: sialidase family protein [Myxococcota bacterium]